MHTMYTMLEESLTRVENEITEKGYQYYFRNKLRTHGTIDYEITNDILSNSTILSKIIVTKYFYNNNNNNVKTKLPSKNMMQYLRNDLSFFDSLGINENNPVIIEKQQQDFIKYKPIELTEIDLDNDSILYFIKDGIIVGYIYSVYETDFEFIAEVAIKDSYRGLGLCKLMVKCMILNINLTYVKDLNYYLSNAGGYVACKCYIKAFQECGYSAYSDKDASKPFQCKPDANYEDIFFTPIQQVGGKTQNYSKKRKYGKKRSIRKRTKKGKTVKPF